MRTITELAKANVKKDRTRSILIMISITLTTLLLTAVSGAGYGLIRMQAANAAELYGEFYGIYRDVTVENIEEMARHAEFTSIGMSADYAEVDIAGSQSHNAALYDHGSSQMGDGGKTLILTCMDETARAMSRMQRSLAEGRCPEADNEIAAAPRFFQMLGVENPKIGDTVTIAFRTDLKSTYRPEEFVICGFLKQSDLETYSMAACTSIRHFEKSVAMEDRRYTVLFCLDDSVNMTFDNSEDVMKALAVRCGIDERNVAANDSYLSWKLDPGTETIAVCAVVCAGVIFFSVIVIYNIFQVGVIQKVQEYGKLKAIGATRRQMRQIILREGMYLAGVGVPPGLLLGIGVARAALEYIIRDMNASGFELKMTGVSVLNVPLLALMAALALAAVWLALRKPMRVVASISAVEAMRYQETGRNAGLRRGKRELRIISLTFANLVSHKKRTVSTILSMGLSCVLFVVLANWLGNMDAEYAARDEVKHGQFALQLRYNLKDEAYPENNLNHILENNPLNDELIREIREIPEVTDVRTQSILYAERLDAEGNETGELYSVLVLDREDFDREVKNDEMEGLDYDEMSARNAVCYGTEYYMEDNGFEIGGDYCFSLYDGVAKKRWTPQMIAAFRYLGAYMAMTRDTYEKMGFTGVTNYDIWIDCAPEDVEVVAEALKRLTDGIGHIAMDSYQNQLRAAKFSMRIMKLPAYLFCVIITFISFMNMANTMITNIITRKQEFGVLQAVGMTNRQLDHSLWIEGMVFSAGTAAVSLVAGTPLGYALFRYCKVNSFVGLSVYHFPFREVLFLFCFIGVLQMVLSFVLSRNVRKESLVERIRYHG